MTISFLEIFRGLAWLAMHGPCMANYTLVLDSGSQRSYITDNLWKLLKLKTIRNEKVSINLDR